MRSEIIIAVLATAAVLLGIAAYTADQRAEEYAAIARDEREFRSRLVSEILCNSYRHITTRDGLVPDPQVDAICQR